MVARGDDVCARDERDMGKVSSLRGQEEESLAFLNDPSKLEAS